MTNEQRCIGVELGDATTAWALAIARNDVHGGSFPSAVTLGEHRVDAFMPRLGDSTPIMIGGTPYGVEALAARLLEDAVRAAGGAGEGTVVAIAHADGLDEFRTGLLIEAARLAGVAPAAVELVTRADALATLLASGVTVADELRVAAGAALAAAARRQPVAAEPTGETFVAGTTAAVAGTGTAIGAAATADATAAAPALGYTGTALPVEPTGYAGTALPAPTTGYAGTPLAPPAEGFAGTELPPAVEAPTEQPIGAKLRKLLRSKGAVVAAGLVVVATAGTVLAVRGGDDKPATATATTVAGGVPTTSKGGSVPDDLVPDALNGLQATLLMHDFLEVPNPILDQRASLPDSQTISIVCGPTKCLIPAFAGVHAMLFERDAPSVTTSEQNVDYRGFGEETGPPCVFVATIDTALTRQADGTYTGTITRTAERLLFQTTRGSCYNFNAIWDVTTVFGEAPTSTVPATTTAATSSATPPTT